MKRILSLVLALLLFCSALASCSETTTEGDAAQNTPTAAGEAVPAEEEDPTAALYADLPAGSYGGYTFAFLNNISNFAYTIMSAEEITGEGINDAVFNRNKQVEDALDIVIEEHLMSYSDVTNNMNTSIAANDDLFSVFWNEAGFVAPFAISGKLINVNEIEALDLSKPWWESGAMSEIQILEKLFFLVGDIHLMFKESFWMTGYNRSIIDNNQLENPYDLVKEGTWTLDKMRVMMETAARDLDGNGTMDGSDLFGVTCYGGCVTPLYMAADEVLMQRNAEGVPENVVLGDRFFSVYEKIVSTMFTADALSRYVCLDGKTQNISQYQDGWHGVFLSGHALFYLEPIGSLKKLREMEDEFGIVPFPKYDEAQQNHITYIANYAAMCGVPITCADIERAGTILENLCAYSFGDLREAYVDTTLNFKYIRDTESKEMLNLILSTGRFNLCDIMNVTTIKSTIQSSAESGKDDIASAVAKTYKAADKMLAKNLETILSAGQ